MVLATAMLVALVQANPVGGPEASPHYKLAKSYNQPDAVDAALESSGLASPKFEVRYAALLVKIHRAFAAGRGFQALHQSILSLSADGGPTMASSHFKALADGVKKAACCGSCTDGRVKCAKCNEKGTRDVPCAKCEGKGRVKPPGVLPSSNATVKCRNCDGNAVFKNVRCPDCAGQGKDKCGACSGEPWAEAKCKDKDCRYGRTSCPVCKGSGEVKSDCPDCDKGRFRPKGAVGGTDLSAKCRTCEKPNGEHGDGFLRDDCRPCSKSGRVTCKGCGGTFGKGPAAEPHQVSTVLRVEKCGACAGEGWPKAKPGTSCPKCLGLGVRVLPTADPARVLE